ncbi:MAG: hypothetical protein JXA61_01735 [Bacteroidales bacterium]|nr:hypothetical protein [Bacteroidales bacterium]
MTRYIITPVLAVLIQAMAGAHARNLPEEYLGLPGDNLNLYAVMQLFQESETIEGFERNLNDENSRINNLDLNDDNLVDYIAVFDYVDGDVHTIVLRAVLNKDEYQDVAVFTVERFRNGSVWIQLIGDEALYGRNYIIEPIYAETPNPGYIGIRRNPAVVNVVRTTYFEVAAWPLIRFIYLPDYIVWRSVWYWGYYPVYWRPWNPFYWHFYYGYHFNRYAHYYRYYRHWDHLRFARYNDFYHSRIRIFSPTVVININKGSYNSTYSRPELRRDGEALYNRVQASRETGSQNNTAVNNQARRSVSSSLSGSSASAGSAGSDTRRRSVDDVSKGAENTGNSVQNTATTRRSVTTITGENRNWTTDNQSGDAARRVSTPSVTKVKSGTPAGQNNSPARRSTTAEKAASGTSAGQSASTSRRSTNTTFQSTSSGPSSGLNTSTTKRSTANKIQSTVPSPAKSQNKSVARSSSSPVSARTASTPKTMQRSGNVSASSGKSSSVNSSSERNRSSSRSASASTPSNNSNSEINRSSSASRR